MQIDKTGYPVIDKALKESQPIIDGIIARTKEQHLTDGKPFRKYDAEYIQMFFTWKMVKALCNYIVKTDTAKNLTFNARQGSIEIGGNILRDGESYYFSTRSIIAGGYIQRLHIRYISDTNLPRIGAESEAEKKIKKAMQLLTKKENIKKEIEVVKIQIVKGKEKLKERRSVSVEDYLNADEFYVQVRDTGYQSDNDAPVHKDEATFDAFLAEVKSHRIKRYKQEIIWAKEGVEGQKNRLKKLKQELKEL